MTEADKVGQLNVDAAALAGVLEYEELHFGDVLQSWGNGVQLDVRVKLAVDWLKTGMLVRREGEDFELTPEHAKELATFALNLSTALLDVAHTRGLVKPLPDTDELSGPHRLHLRRSTRAQVVTQLAAQRIGLEESQDGPRLTQLPPGAKVPT